MKTKEEVVKEIGDLKKQWMDQNLKFVDKIKDTEMVVFNRLPKGEDQMQFHTVVRAISRRCDIAYEYVDGKVSESLSKPHSR